ncbi:MAG: NAD(P)/FAD-dependent oxidoreductase [Pseudomonadales bacterium]
MDALKDAVALPVWHDSEEKPEPLPSLATHEQCELLIVGGGFTGLWAAIQAKERAPDTDIVLIEKTFIADGASGRNGGFLCASIAHGESNIALRFDKEAEQLEALGEQNIRELLDTLKRYNIDARYENTGMTELAKDEAAAQRLHEEYLELKQQGKDVVWYDKDTLQTQIKSPLFCAGLLIKNNDGIVDPARLCWGLKRVLIEHYGVRIYEGTEMLGIEQDGRSKMRTKCAAGTVGSDKVLIATNAYTSPYKPVNRSTIPIWDYQIATEPLTKAQLEKIQWGLPHSRHALEDYVNMFHYFRLTKDNRITWGGGGDVRYYFNRGTGSELMNAPDRHERLAREFFEMFPQLEGELKFTHKWGGIIASSTRFCMVPESAFNGRLAWSVGYTGLGVGASRFGARVAIEMLGYGPTDILKLDFITRKALPWAPEPLRWLGVRFTQYELARADRNGGQRGLWLKLLDRFGLGFAC